MNKKDVVQKMTKRKEKMADKRREIIYYTFETENLPENQKLREKKENV